MGDKVQLTSYTKEFVIVIAYSLLAKLSWFLYGRVVELTLKQWKENMINYTVQTTHME